jgi:hypothetical protein
MEQISAAENVTIEMAIEYWRLLKNGAEDPYLLVEARSGSPLNYVEEFATTRRLPENGSLSIDHIQRVVLGWSNVDESWHLGLLLEAELAQARGSRWCEMAHWPDPSTAVFSDIATRAAESLAQVTTRPFYLVPPQPKAPEKPSRPLPELPLSFDNLWQLEQADAGNLQLVRSRRWASSKVRRILWYLLWVVVYIVLVVANLTSGIAPANPPFLPLLGALAAMILAGLIGHHLYSLLTEPNRFVIDTNQRQIRAHRGKRIRWQARAEQIQSIYVSQLVNEKKRKSRKPSASYGELNLHLTTGKFQPLIAVEQIEDYAAEAGGTLDNPQTALPQTANVDSVDSLTLHSFTTSLQAAGLYIAQALDLDAVYDQRMQ